MGKGGVEPQYFLTRMQWWEVQSYMDGLMMRDMVGYRQMRILAANVLNGIGAKINGGPVRPQDIITLPDDEQDNTIPEEQDAEALQAFLDKCAEYNEKHG